MRLRPPKVIGVSGVDCNVSINLSAYARAFWGFGHPRFATVASYRRRQLLAEEVPGLYIRRLTLEDPKGAKDRSQSSSARHVCYPRRRPSPPLIGPGRKTSSYRGVTQWFDQMKTEVPPFLTITSLQLPDSPIPLIDSQAIARCRSRRDSTPAGASDANDDNDAIMDELLGKVAAVRGHAEGQRSKRNKDPRASSATCNSREFTDLEECTRRIIEGPGCPVRKKSPRSRKATDESETRDCICSEVSENLRINIRKKTEVRRSSRSPSPEVTHVIRIAMKYHGQQDCPEQREVTGVAGPRAEKEEIDNKRNVLAGGRPGGCCPGVSVALDFTLNCSSLQLTSRDVCVKTDKKRGSLTRLGDDTRSIEDAEQ
ncbi:uncharacterized protein LOC110116862 [Athalia rosae]|uniref:uncharacterized protein LOC110116862 n=1 Tax=Athalia rosae TaxID=37344 RepID=UPI002033BD24|nr:uncharacterized protein LOC110116862 [Athalia rosae]